jgi:hypothetical protein
LAGGARLVAGSAWQLVAVHGPALEPPATSENLRMADPRPGGARTRHAACALDKTFFGIRVSWREA